MTASRSRHLSQFVLPILLVLATCGTALGQSSLDELLRRAEAFEKQRETRKALEVLMQAHQADPTNATVLIRVARHYSDLIFETPGKDAQKNLAHISLSYARKAVELEPGNALAQLSVAVCLAKNFPYLDNQTKVNYSREVKERTEKAIELDPNQDLAYHMLGRWHYEVADMGSVVKGLMRLLYGALPKGTFELAETNFETAARLAPDRIIHRLELARVKLKLSRRQEAVADLQKCIAMSPIDKDDQAAQQAARDELRKLGVKLPAAGAS